MSAGWFQEAAKAFDFGMQDACNFCTELLLLAIVNERRQAYVSQLLAILFGGTFVAQPQAAGLRAGTQSIWMGNTRCYLDMRMGDEVG